MNEVASKPPRQKEPPIRLQKLRDSARGETCLMRLDDCAGQDTRTCVLAHVRSGYNKGMGSKPDDCVGVTMCASCHDMYDGRRKAPYTREEMDAWFFESYAVQVARWIRQGVLK